MKKLIAMMLALAFVLCILASCSPNESTQTEQTEPVDTEYVAQKEAKVEGTTLKSGVGACDSNGKYVVPENITEIGEGAFAGDDNLVSVIIGPNVRYIDSGAFATCVNLKSVEMTDSVEEIGSHCFYGCTTLTNVVLSKNIKEIHSYCFGECAVLEKIVIPEGVTKIGHIAFGNCYALYDVTLPISLEVIEYQAFANCISLDKIDFQSLVNLEIINTSAFYGCIFRKVILPEGLKTIGTSAFSENKKLVNVSIPDSVTTIGISTFYNTPFINEITDEYYIVGDGILLKCNALPDRIDLSGKGIKTIADCAFQNAGESDLYAEYGYKYASKLKSIVIPEGVETISARAFMNCYALETVVFPSTLKSIGASAFLMSYYETMTEFATFDFSKCDKLETISGDSFNGCMGITEITIPSTVQYVGSGAFENTQVFYDFYNSVKQTDAEVSYYVVNNVLLFVNVPKNITSVTLPSDVRIVAGNALCGWNLGQVYTDEDLDGFSPYYRSKHNLTYKVTELNISDGVEIICDYAFYRMPNLTTLTIPDSVTTIYEHAFAASISDQSKLRSIKFSKNLEYIGADAFIYHSALQSINLPNSVVIVESEAFGYTGISEIAFPKNLTQFGTSIFSIFTVSSDLYTAENLSHVYISRDVKFEIYDIIGFTKAVTVTYYD